jgi:hypothetical protein
MAASRRAKRVSHEKSTDQEPIPSVTAEAAETVPTEGVLEALKIILVGAPLPEVLTSITRIMEAQNPWLVCSIFLLEPDGQHLRYATAPNLPEFFRAGTDGMAIGPEAGSCGTAVYRRRAVFATDVYADPLWPAYRGFIQGGHAKL